VQNWKLVVGVALLAASCGWGVGAATSSETPSSDGGAKRWEVFALGDLQARRADSGRAYHKFIDVETLNAGLYELPAGGTDRQKPHDQDELYYIVSGRGRFLVDGERVDAGPGMVIFVKAGVEHRFEEISEDLSVLVFFSAAASS